MRNELSDLPMNRSRTLPWKALGPGPQEPPFEFCLSSVFQGLLAFLPIARIWFDLVQLKPDNKTPQYEAYLLSWILLPLLGILLTRFLGRFRPGGIPPHIYLRTSVFLNFILLLAAYWDIQRPDPAPVLFWAALYLLTQAAAWTWASGWGRSPYWRRPSFSAWIYPAMAVLFLGWLTRIDPAWEGRLRPWHLANWLFAAALAYAFLVDLDPRSVRARWGTSSRAWGLVLTVLLTAFFAFLFVDPTGSDCPYNQGYYLGPLADFVNGKTLLVDINSQYGVLLFFFLRLFFPAALPLGFHSFFFFDALLRLCQYVVFFWIARKLFKSILYPALGTVVLILLNCGLGPTSALWYPSQGALRFGFIFLLAALVVLRNRHPRWAAWFLGLESATAAVAFFWSFEVCFYTVPPYLAFTAYETLFSGRPLREAVPAFFRRLAPLAAGIALLLAFLYAFTWLRTGQLPHWDRYFDYVMLYRDGFMMLDTPLLGIWWIPVGILFFSYCLLLFPGKGHPPDRNVLVLVVFYGIFQLFYYFGRSVDTNLYPLAMPAVLCVLYWLHELRVRRLPMAPAAQALCLAAALGLLLYTVQPILAGTGERLGRQCRQMSFPEMARRFLRTAHDLPRDGDFAAAAGRLMGKYSGGQKFPAYFFGMEGVEVAMYDGRSKAYPYDDPDQALIVRRTVERILSTDPPLRPGDCVYTSSGMHYGKPVLGGKRRLEEALFDRLRSRYALQRVDVSGGVTVYRVMGAKGDGGDP